MGLESGVYINALNPANPTGGDVRSSADDHLRLIKSTIKATFPNISGAVNASHAVLNKLGTTPTVGDNSTDPASTAFVQATLANAAVNGAMAVVLQPATTGTASPGQHVVCTNVAATALTLPAAPPSGSRVWVTTTNGLTTNTIARNGALLDGVASNFAIGGNGTVKLRYIDATRGWIVESDRSAPTWARIADKPTTIGGYGITDLASAAGLGIVYSSAVNSYPLAASQTVVCTNAAASTVDLPAAPTDGLRLRVLFINSRLDNRVFVTGGKNLVVNGVTIASGSAMTLDKESNRVYEFLFIAFDNYWRVF